MCLVVTKGDWVSKNKEPIRGSTFLFTVYKEGLPYEWCYFPLPISNELVDLNEVIKGLDKEDLTKIEVEEEKHDRVKSIKKKVPKEVVEPNPLFIPILLHRSDKKFVGMTSTEDYNRQWEALGKRAAITTSLHHLDRGDFLSVSHILEDIALSDKYVPIIEDCTSHNPVMGFTMTIGDEESKTIVDHLYDQLFITKTREKGFRKKAKHQKIMNISRTAFQAFWKYYVDDVGIARTANYEDVLVRSNFSPHLGYWDLDFDPTKINDEVLEKKLVRCLTRYLRAHELFEGVDLNIGKVLDRMSDHGYYSALKDKYVEVYNMILDGRVEESMDKFKKVKYNPSPYSMCNHMADWKPVSTAYNFTVNTKTKAVYYTHGTPCKNRLTIKYKLE